MSCKSKYDAKTLSPEYTVLRINYDTKPSDQLELLGRIPWCAKFLLGPILGQCSFSELCYTSGCLYCKGTYNNSSNNRAIHHVGRSSRDEL